MQSSAIGSKGVTEVILLTTRRSASGPCSPVRTRPRPHRRRKQDQDESRYEEQNGSHPCWFDDVRGPGFLDSSTSHLEFDEEAPTSSTQCQSLICMSSGEGEPAPVSTYCLRLSRYFAHFVLQWERNSTGRPPRWAKFDDGVPVAAGQSELDAGADPLRAVRRPPATGRRPRLELDDLHVETAGREAELDLPTHRGVSGGVDGPPARGTVDGRQRVVDRRGALRRAPTR